MSMTISNGREPFYVWTVFENPQDYLGLFVARRFNFDQPTGDVRLATTLDAIRAAIPQGLYRLERNPLDDRCVVESWV
ncbi:hypothetical protein [Acidovorax sp.]|uniref:hypothetical protein n=1 Tax=Acidovorax sp. TaxID=1872122 RepID=UPI00391F261E